MKKNIQVFLLILFFHTLVYAQIFSTSLDFPISMNVQNSLTISKVKGELDFGEVLSTPISQSLTIDPEFGVLFEVIGISRERIMVDYTANVILNNYNWVSLNPLSEPDDLTFTPDVRQTGARSTYINSTNLRNGKRIRLSNDNGIGKLYIWVGGDLVINPNQKAGEYEGSFNITVTY